MGDTKILSPKPKYNRPNPFSSTPVSTGATVTQERFQEAVVLDVVLNDAHSEFQPDGYNVGCVKFRTLVSQATRDVEALHWAFPLEANMEEFPLKNEVVLVFQSLNRFYYMPKMNLGNSPSNQAFSGLETEFGPPPTPVTRAANRQSSRANPIQRDTVAKKKLGNYFKEQPKILHLRHLEGDKVIEGRSGHSIRFGTSWMSSDIHQGVFQSSTVDQAPNLLIRVGPSLTQVPRPNTAYGRVIEDINDDQTSLWLVTDQVVPIRLATEGTPYNGRSVTDFPSKFDGNQVVLNTGRLILNSKTDKVLVHSFKGIHLSTLKDGTWDAEQDFIVRTGRRTSIMSPKIHLGSASSTSDRMMLGDTFIEALKLLVQAHLTNQASYAISPVGPCTLSPAVTAAWQSFKQKIDTFVSQDNYVSRTNQR